MVDTIARAIANQFEASFCTLHACIDQCPASAWDGPVANLAYCQVAFHALFFADLYLGADELSLRPQQFHRDHPDFFRDYEELQPRNQQLLYERPTTRLYLEHCRKKALDTIAKETSATLRQLCGFPPREFSRTELHIYNIRHIQHHAAQLSLRLRINWGVDIPWVGSGWHDQ